MKLGGHSKIVFEVQSMDTVFVNLGFASGIKKAITFVNQLEVKVSWCFVFGLASGIKKVCGCSACCCFAMFVRNSSN
jgi:hypothetical protein